MAQQRLDKALLDKMAAKYGKSAKYVREQVCRRAARADISSTAAQIIWAKQLGIGVANRLSKVSAEIRAEVRSGGAEPLTLGPVRGSTNSPPAVRRAPAPITAGTIRTLLVDDQLHGRCKDLLVARRHFDRVIREATTVLDDRLKKRTGIKNMNPDSLVGKVISPDPAKAILEISSERSEQEGMHGICKGIMLAFRNPSHHSLTDRFTREDALKFCGFVDTVLGLIQKATVHTDRI